MSLKILHTLESLSPHSGGPARSVPGLAIAQAALGMKVGIWCPSPGTQSIPELPDDSYSNISLYSGPMVTWRKEFGDPDLIHDHGIWTHFHQHVATICREKNIPRIVSPRGMLTPWALNYKKWKKKIAWWLYQRKNLQQASMLHATAESESKQLRHIRLSSPITVIPNGVDLSAVQSKSGKVESKVRTALFLSRVHEKKGLLMWVEVWNRLRPEGWRMRVIGPDENGHRAKVEAMVRKAGLEKDWSFEGSLEGNAKWQAMAEADLFVLPSFGENFGIVVAEALGAGLPVVTTTATPWQGLITNDCGWWVDPSVDSLEAGFYGALTRIAEFPQMGQRGKAWVQRDFGWEPIAEQMIASYEWLLGQETRPSCILASSVKS